MSLVRRNNLEQYRDPFATMARNLLTWDPFTRAEERPGGFAARFEVKESDDAFQLIGDFPGMKEEDIEIALDGDTLTVSGSRNAEAKKENETFYVYERQYGSFSRSFRLPEHADKDEIAADLEAGVLTLTIPKKEASRPRKISLTKKV